MKYNKTGKSLQGNINTIVRSSLIASSDPNCQGPGLHVYQIKGNAMTSLSVQPPSCTTPSLSSPCMATFNGKANIQDITDPLNAIPIDGNAALQVTMTDRGEPGVADQIGITVWNKSGGLWFSSNWNGTKTTEQVLGGGNLVVH